jgi:glycosyltransferase involved in cell wall biosynthesis
MSQTKTIDIIASVRNEEKNIPFFIKEVNKLDVPGVKISIVFAEDGSSDNTVNILRDAAKANSNVSYLCLDNQYGQNAALFFAMSLSKADAVITMDADNGHPIDMVKPMIEYFLKGNNVVQCVRAGGEKRKIYREIGTFLYDAAYSIIVGINLFRQNISFRLLDKRAKEIFLKHKYLWYSLKTNFTKKDNVSAKYLKCPNKERAFGKSQYNLYRLSKLALGTIYSDISLKRFAFWNILLGALTACFICCKIFPFAALIAFFIVLNIVVFTRIKNFYPIDKIKILEKTEHGIKKEKRV